jgi:hypothetical protein
MIVARTKVANYLETIRITQHVSQLEIEDVPATF